MNDPRKQQSQMVERYVAGKSLEGESISEIADGVVDPVERTNYVAEQARNNESQSEAPQNTSLQNWVASLFFIALCILCMLLPALLRLR